MLDLDNSTTATTAFLVMTMKGVLLLLTVFLVSVYHLDAFVAPASVQLLVSSPTRGDTSTTSRKAKMDENAVGRALQHKDIVWKIRPPPETRRLSKVFSRIAANLIRLDCWIKRTDAPVLLCPKGGQAVLEAHYKSPSNPKKLVKIGRFGVTTESGPPVPEIQESVADLYGLDPAVLVRTAAIIYMFVEPEYRKSQAGQLALQVISLIHAVQGCDFTVLVADDDGSQKLVEWYEQNGYTCAPKLQNVFGSPGKKYGTTMMAPTQSIRVLTNDTQEEQKPTDCIIQWW